MAFNLMQFAAGDKRTCEINGHSISYHLLDIGEELEVSRLCAPFLSSPGLESAVKTATFALSVDTIDGGLLFAPISPEPAPEERFKKACGFYRWWIEAWFKRYEKAQDEYMAQLEDFKKKSAN